MPSFYTHKKTYNDSEVLLTKQTRNTLPNFSNNKLLLGHDSLLFPAIGNYIINKNPSQNKCIMLGHNNLPLFVANYIKIAKNTGAIEDENIRLYIIGYIAHHITDAYLHPLITHYGGGKDNYLPTKNQKRWLHGIIETSLDAYLIRKYENVDPLKFKIFDNFDFKGQISPNLKDILNNAGLYTYDLPDIGNKLLALMNVNIKYLKIYLRAFHYDPKGRKIKLYNLVDDLTKSGCSFFSNYVDYRNMDAFLNNKNNEWPNPFDQSIISNKSMLELLRDATIEIGRITNELEKINQKSTHNNDDIFQVVPNISAITGLEGGTPLTITTDKRKILLNQFK